MINEDSNTQDWWGELTEAQKQHLIEGLNDAKNGRVVSSKDFWEKLKNS